MEAGSSTFPCIIWAIERRRSFLVRGMGRLRDWVEARMTPFGSLCLGYVVVAPGRRRRRWDFGSLLAEAFKAPQA